MSSVSVFQIKAHRKEYNQKRQESLKAIDNIRKYLTKQSQQIREEKRKNKILKRIEELHKNLQSTLQEIDLHFYTEMKVHLKKDPFVRVYYSIEMYSKEIIKQIERDKAYVEEKRKKLDKMIEKIETFKGGKTIFSKNVLQKISQFDKSLAEKDIEEAEKQFKKIIQMIDKTVKEEKGLKKLEKLLSNLKLEEPEVKKSVSLLEEEKKLKEERERELKGRSLAIKMLIKSLSETLPEPLKGEAEEIIKKPVLSTEDLSAFLTKYSNWKEKEALYELEKELKEKVKSKLKEKGYSLISDNEFMLFSKKEGYKTAVKINNGKITSKFIREIDHQPSEYDKIKDKEELSEWCKDLEEIINHLEQDGIAIRQITNIPDLMDINYEVKEETTERKKQLTKEE